MSTERDKVRLFRIKLVHTLAWAVFAGAIVALPVATAAGRFGLAAGLSALVWCEIIVLLANGLRCPLRDVAARYTADRAANFDIFLPAWLSRHNKLIFGTAFAAGELHLALTWPR